MLLATTNQMMRPDFSPNDFFFSYLGRPYWRLQTDFENRVSDLEVPRRFRSNALREHTCLDSGAWTDTPEGEIKVISLHRHDARESLFWSVILILLRSVSNGPFVQPPA